MRRANRLPAGLKAILLILLFPLSMEPYQGVVRYMYDCAVPPEKIPKNR